MKSEDGILYDNDDNKGDVRLLVFGDNGSSGPVDLRGNDSDTKRYDGQSGTIKKKAFDAGKVKESMERVEEEKLFFIDDEDCVVL